MLWKDIDGLGLDCMSTCRKSNLIVFRIMKSEDGFYADYYNNRLFISPSLTYLEAAQMAKEKYGKDSIKNRLNIAKEYFLEDYREQVSERIRTLQSMSV